MIPKNVRFMPNEFSLYSLRLKVPMSKFYVDMQPLNGLN